MFKKNAQKVFTTKSTRRDELDKLSNLTDKQEDEFTKLMGELAEKFPDKKDLVLPTAFGNAIRAFEVYPRVMYGMEIIDSWPRILAFVPKDFRDLIDDAKAQVDWWINLSFVSFLLLIEFWVVIFYKWKLTLNWAYIILNILVPLALFVGLNWFFLSRATSSAVSWGDFVKAAFDVYRFRLLKSMSLDVPKTRDAESELWMNFSQAIAFRFPDSLPELKKTADPDEAENCKHKR
jgi:hypothetical protein